MSVGQGAASGSESILGPGVTPCDGRWHRSTVRVSPDAGSFAAGAATVDVFLGAFDPVEGDLEATDTETVTLLPPFACRVKNTTQDTWFATEDGAALTNAIAAAGAGDHLNVFGTCVGTYVIDRDLNISGSHSLVFPTTLDAGGPGPGALRAGRTHLCAYRDARSSDHHGRQRLDSRRRRRPPRVGRCHRDPEPLDRHRQHDVVRGWRHRQRRIADVELDRGQPESCRCGRRRRDLQLRRPGGERVMGDRQYRGGRRGRHLQRRGRCPRTARVSGSTRRATREACSTSTSSRSTPP